MTARQVIEAVCEKTTTPISRFWHVPGNRATEQVRDARMVAAYLMRVMLGMSFPEIAKTIGLASHRDVCALVTMLTTKKERMDLAVDLWWELEQSEITRGLELKIAKFEQEVGLHWVR